MIISVYETAELYHGVTLPFIEKEKFSVSWVYNFLGIILIIFIIIVIIIIVITVTIGIIIIIISFQSAEFITLSLLSLLIRL